MIANHDMEQALLGAVLVAAPVLPDLVAVEGVTPATFDRPSHQVVFEAMVDMAAAGERIDPQLLSAELTKREGDLPNDLIADLLVAADPGPVTDYARRLKTMAELRSKRAAALDLAAAAEAGDAQGVAAAEGRLADAVETRSRRRSKHERRDALTEMVEGRGTVWPTPFGGKINGMMAGGLRPGQFTVLGGWTSHGKSVAATQLLTSAAAKGARCALYTNEMEATELDARDVARQARVPFMRIVTGSVGGSERERVDDAIAGLGDVYTLVEAAGMTADEVAYDLRRERWDLAVIDLLNGLPNSTETKDIDRNMATLAAATRQSGSHLVGCQHLNQSRHVGKLYPPEPGMADIRGSGGIGNLANNVLFVYLEESDAEPGQPSMDAVMSVAKWRGGVRGRAELTFDPHRMVFLEQPPVGMVGVPA